MKPQRCPRSGTYIGTSVERPYRGELVTCSECGRKLVLKAVPLADREFQYKVPMHNRRKK